MSNGPQTIPLDDMELEMQEMEGLVSIREKKKNAATAVGGGRCTRCDLLVARWVIVSFLLMVAVFLVWMTHGNTIKDTAGLNGESDNLGESKTTSNESKGSAAGDAGASKRYAYAEDPFAVRTENPPPPAVLKQYAEKWGTWKLGELPWMDRDSFCSGYSHCDVPSDKFPSNAWQSDSAFVAKFLDEADKLVDRAMHAILAEYGKSPDDSAMFDLTYKEWSHRQLPKIVTPDNGGWTTTRSMQGLSRRLLHAIMTRDTFTFVMGGHSAAAGHGNHFKQSYTMQFHKVMEPVLSYLGVQLISRNLAQGGLGTIQSALGSADIYGDEIDFLLWDSGMTEGRDGRALDMFGRQALMSHRVPVLWNLYQSYLQVYHEECDADVGYLGTAMSGIPVSKDEEQVTSLPFATQYMICEKEHKQMCGDPSNRFRANCWVDRPDVSPPTKQDEHPGSQVKWHPGFRVHQLVGRTLAYTVLIGLKEAIAMWKNAEANTLPDDAWHVTDYYDNIRNKVMNLDTSAGPCEQYDGIIPVRMCNVQVRARTEFTPRAKPDRTSIRSILKTNDYAPTVKGDLLYDGPDVRNPMFDIPDGQVDVLAILNNGRQFPEEKRSRQLSVEPIVERHTSEMIVPGKGYELVNHPVGYCDGSYNAICARDAENPCLLKGHHDGRNGLFFNEYSGWIVMEMPKVKHGIIVVKMETWHWPEEVPMTEGWTSVNNERHLRSSPGSIEKTRHLKQEPPEYCDDFHFDASVDGNITSWNVSEFEEANHAIQRVVEVVTLLDDPNYVKRDEEKDIEVAIRMRGCGREKVFSLTHVYWA